MRVLVTGATGFVGRWLVPELVRAGHEAIPLPGSARLDIGDAQAVESAIHESRPHAIAHLAGVASSSAARRDPERTFRTNVDGTRNVLVAAAGLAQRVPVLFTSTSEVYAPRFDGAAITESSALSSSVDPYGASKQAAERLMLDARAQGRPTVVMRAFNHTGPGQRTEYAIPAFARRIVAAKAAGEGAIVAGNVDVERDIGDVRDTVHAYRLVLENLVAAQSTPAVLNVATGRSIPLRDIIGILARLADVQIEVRRDATLARRDDPPRIVGDAALLRAMTGWKPKWTLEATLMDVLADVVNSRA